MTGKEDAANNYARGHYTIGKCARKSILKSYMYITELKVSLHAILFTNYSDDSFIAGDDCVGKKLVPGLTHIASCITGLS